MNEFNDTPTVTEFTFQIDSSLRNSTEINRAVNVIRDMDMLASCSGDIDPESGAFLLTLGIYGDVDDAVYAAGILRFESEIFKNAVREGPPINRPRGVW